MPDLNERIQTSILEAQVFSRKHLVLELDFSFGSIEELESHIDTVEYAIPGGKSEENVAMLTRVWGCYLGESLRRQIGGEWVEDDSDQNEGLAVRVNEQVLYPLEQMRKRLLEGNAHNIAAYFQQIEEQA